MKNFAIIKHNRHSKNILCSVAEGQVLLTTTPDSHAVQHMSWGNSECRCNGGSRPLVQNKTKEDDYMFYME